jgi:hypothetical protein
MIETVEDWRQARCDFVIRREPARLGDLARWMRDTDGPVAAMDASLSSLEDLWRWFVGFVFEGCPGVPDGSRPEEFQWYVPNAANDELRFAGKPELHWRALFAAESVNHYVMCVMRRVDPSARWDVFVEPKSKRPGVVTGLAGQTGIRIAGPAGGFAWPAATMMTVNLLQAEAARARGESDVDDRYRDWLDPARFWFMNARWFPEGVLPESQERQESVLQPFLDRSHVPWDAPEREQPPMYASHPAALAKDPREHVKWSISGRHPQVDPGPGVELMSLYPVLSAERASAELARLGFIDGDGQRITVDALMGGGSCIHPTIGVEVQTFVYDGGLRELTVDGGVPPGEYKSLKRAFERVAKTVKAELTEGY